VQTYIPLTPALSPAFAEAASRRQAPGEREKSAGFRLEFISHLIRGRNDDKGRCLKFVSPANAGVQSKDFIRTGPLTDEVYPIMDSLVIHNSSLIIHNS
jgi:hypothetical protein